MPNVTFDFKTRGAAEVRQNIQRIVSSAQAASGRSAAVQQQASQAALKEIAKQEDAARRAEEKTTATTTREAAKRVAAEAKATQAAAKEHQKLTAAVAREEAAMTAVVSRESSRRTAILRTAAAAMRGAWTVGGTLGRAALSAAPALHSSMQSARRAAAATETTMNGALYQAGIGGAQSSQMQRMLQEAVTRGPLRGLTSDSVASGIAAAQTQFNVLSAGVTRNMTPAQRSAQRMQNFQGQLSAAEFARNTYQDPSEVMRFAGMLGAQGLNATDQRSTLMAATGLAQSGSVELGNITREALGPLMQNIAVATGRLGAGADPTARSAAVAEATRRTLAVGEVAAGAGLSQRDSLNAYAKLQRNLSSDVVTGNLYESVMARRGGTRFANELFETQRDSRGQQVHRIRGGIDALQAVSRLHGFMGGDTTAMMNLLQGGGGERMVLDAQVRRNIAGLISQTSGGQSVADRVNEMLTQGSAFSEADVSRGREMRSGEATTRIVSNEELHREALTQNTGVIGTLSQRVEDLTSQFPMLTAAVGALGISGAARIAGVGASAVSGAAGLGGSAVTGALGYVAPGAAAALGTTASLTAGASAAAATVGTVLAGAAVGLGAGQLINSGIARATTGTNADGTAQDTNAFGLLSAGTFGALVQELRDLPTTLGTALRGVTISAAPQGVAHAANVAALEATHRATRDGTR